MKPPGTRRLFLLVLAFPFVLAACAGTRSASDPSGNRPGSDSTALLMDETLAPLLFLKEQIGQRDPATGAFVAEALITNRTFEWLDLECRTLFKNAAGATLETSPWKALRLDPASRVVYTAPSLKPDATRFITQIRRAPKR